MEKFSEFTDADSLDVVVGLKNGTNAKTTKIGNVGYATFNTVQSQQAYTVAALSGKTTSDIIQIVIGQTIQSPDNYSLLGTTLTFSNFTVSGPKAATVLFKTS